jgi:hypothetical protein
VVAQKSDIAITQGAGSLVQMNAGSKLADVVKALNALGATPQDLLAILQAMKSAGALNAELEVICWLPRPASRATRARSTRSRAGPRPIRRPRSRTPRSNSRRSSCRS